MKKIYFLNLIFIILFIISGVLCGEVVHAQTYCNSRFYDGSLEYIKNVTYAGINNTTGGTGPASDAPPVDYTGGTPAAVTIGNADILSVTLGGTGFIDEYIYAFIDWNHNGVLNDIGEVYMLASATSSAGPHTISVTPPSWALTGSTRMRVMVDYEGAVPDPCVDDDGGEAEDYTVIVSSGGSLPCDTATYPASAVTVAAPVSGCHSDTVRLGITSSGILPGVPGVLYQWQSAASISGVWTDLGTPGTANIYKTTIQADTVYFRCLVQCGGTTRLTAASTPAVSRIPEPSIDSIIALEMETGTFTFTPAGARQVDSFQWDYGDSHRYTSSGFPASVSHIYTDSGSYNVTLVVYNQCGMNFVRRQVSTSGKTDDPGQDPETKIIAVSALKNISVYPNPASGKLTIENNRRFPIQSLSLVNMTGQEVPLPATGRNKVEVDISTLAPGLYILRIETVDGRFDKKVEIVK